MVSNLNENTQGALEELLWARGHWVSEANTSFHHRVRYGWSLTFHLFLFCEKIGVFFSNDNRETEEGQKVYFLVSCFKNIFIYLLCCGESQLSHANS